MRIPPAGRCYALPMPLCWSHVHRLDVSGPQTEFNSVGLRLDRKKRSPQVTNSSSGSCLLARSLQSSAERRERGVDIAERWAAGDRASQRNAIPPSPRNRMSLLPSLLRTQDCASLRKLARQWMTVSPRVSPQRRDQWPILSVPPSCAGRRYLQLIAMPRNLQHAERGSVPPRMRFPGEGARPPD